MSPTTQLASNVELHKKQMLHSMLNMLSSSRAAMQHLSGSCAKGGEGTCNGELISKKRTKTISKHGYTINAVDRCLKLQSCTGNITTDVAQSNCKRQNVGCGFNVCIL